MRRPSFGFMLNDRISPFVAPWLLGLAAMPVAMLAHWGWGHDPVWIAVLAMTSVLLTLATYFTWRRRSQESQVTATIVTALLLGWVTFAAASSPYSMNMLSSWILGTAALGIVWDIRHVGIKPVNSEDRQMGQPDPLGGAVQSFKGGRVKKIKETADQLKARIQMIPGEGSVDDVRSSKGVIASKAAVGEDQVTVLPVKGRADQVDIAFTHPVDADALVLYSGPSAPGKSIAAAPIHLGRRVDSSDIAWWLTGSDDPANPRQLSHTLVTGMTGAGKTETICTAVIDMRYRTDVVPIVGDPAKFGQSFGDIADCLEIAAKTKAECRQLIKNLSDLVPYRAGLLGSLTRANGQIGYKQWVPECYTLHGIPFVFVDIEEAADVADLEDDDLDNAVRKLRSIGVHLVISMQTAPHDNLARKTRGQFGQSLAHGCQETQDAKYALNSNTLDAGADPTKWGNTSPGSLYAELVGTDQIHWPVDGRVTALTYDQKRAALADSKRWWAYLDEGTKNILGKGILPREEPVATLVQEVPAEVDEPEFEDRETLDLTRVPDADDATQVLDVTRDAPAPRGVKLAFGAPAEEGMSTARARQEMADRIDGLEASGRDFVGFGDLEDLVVVTGRSRAWIYAELKRLVQAGRLREGTGKPPYAIRSRSTAGVS